eukprot:CAMPEP_0183581110 /NCGR_PEP_ID=MMETSP0371-20130417/147045_1 /TAXON_ID=268820 /ORGANISM="Peridinium aciculiferum, Strain PAER-2" /LENGTH=106 /DNA_ID=CAMNT_0025791765 /DNA_START=365 /DNA_END=681 /DNA_ORIENTATION=+
MAALDHSQATVPDVRAVDRQPKGHDLHGPERVVGAVLVPRHISGGVRHLAEVVGGEGCDVRPDEKLHEVQQSRVGHKAYPKGIVAHDRVVPMIRRQPLQVFPATEP